VSIRFLIDGDILAELSRSWLNVRHEENDLGDQHEGGILHYVSKLEYRGYYYMMKRQIQ